MEHDESFRAALQVLMFIFVLPAISSKLGAQNDFCIAQSSVSFYLAFIIKKKEVHAAIE